MMNKISFHSLVLCIGILNWSAGNSSEHPTTAAKVEKSSVPPFLVTWNLKSADNSVTTEFVVREHRYYVFQIAFQGAITASSSEARTQQLKEFEKFVGDGGSHWVTRESADTESPVVLSAAMNASQLHEMMQSGEYVARMTRSGVMIPVHLVIQAQVARGANSVLYDRIITTWNFEASSTDGILRHITSVALRPGTYKVVASTTQAISIPPNVTTLLRVSYRPDTQKLDD
jgi:hypothetical protein